VLLTRSPLGLPQCCHRLVPVRLACVKHAASVHPEPGSNSPTRTGPAEAGSIRCRAHPSAAESCSGRGADLDVCIRVAGMGCRPELTSSSTWSNESTRRTARTGVLSSLPFSRSRGSGTSPRGGLGAGDSGAPEASRERREMLATPLSDHNPSVRKSSRPGGTWSCRGAGAGTSRAAVPGP
jgi:hypothetical protein